MKLRFGGARASESAPTDVLPLTVDPVAEAKRDPSWPRVVISIGALAYGVQVVAAVASGSIDLLLPVVLIPVLAALTYPLAKRVATSERNHAMVQFVMAAFAAKMIGVLLRGFVNQQFYGGVSDATEYHLWGQWLAPQYRSFDFSADVGPLSGTGFMRTITGLVYAVTGDSKLGGAVVFAWLSFVGLLLLWRAFVRAVPDGATRRYGLLVMFLPSFLYWPSALGKDAFAVFCLGVASYGIARLLTGLFPSGFAFAAAGIVGVMLLRPHIALTIFCGLVVAAICARSRAKNFMGPVIRVAIFGALLVIGLVLVSQASSFFGVSRLDQETVNQTLADAEGRTDQGGSSFAPVRFQSNPPYAVATVLFRPFPYEAGSGPSLVTSFEGVFILLLTLASWERIKRIPREMRDHAYIAYCVGVVFTFIYAFSAFSNFGILARQRVQVLPFYLALLCVPKWTPRYHHDKDDSIELLEEKADDPYSAAVAVDPYADAVETEAPDPYVAMVEARIDPYARFSEEGEPNPYAGPDLGHG